MSTPDLETIVSSYERTGGSTDVQIDRCPVFIHCDPTAKKEEWGFETRAASAPWGTRIALATARYGRMGDAKMLAQAGTVYPCIKRAGGPFPDRIGIGRARSTDVSVRFSSISKYHAYLTWDAAASGWVLWDARSRNGTRVGSASLSGAETEGVPLEDGVDVYFGQEAFLFFGAPGFARLITNLAQGRR